MSPKIRFFFVFFCLLIFLPAVYSVSISPSSIIIQFEPKYKNTYTFTVGDANYIEIYKKGDLTEYVTINQTLFRGVGEFTVTIALPDKIEKPGKNRIIIGAMEVPAGGGTVTAVTAIQTPIDVYVPYPGKYIEAGFDAPNVNINEVANFNVFVNNLGTDDLETVHTIVEVFDSANAKIGILQSEKVRIATKASLSFVLPFNTTGFKPGPYKAKATLFYDGDKKNFDKSFKIGDLYIAIKSFPDSIFNGTINKFEIEIESGWNNKIENIYATIDIKRRDGISVIEGLKTPSIDMNPWENKKIAVYIDTKGLYAGEYIITVTLHYKDKTTISEQKLMILEQEILSPKGFQFNSLTVVLISIVILLIIANAVWIIRTIKKRKNK